MHTHIFGGSLKSLIVSLLRRNLILNGRVKETMVQFYKFVSTFSEHLYFSGKQGFSKICHEIGVDIKILSCPIFKRRENIFILCKNHSEYYNRFGGSIFIFLTHSNLNIWNQGVPVICELCSRTFQTPYKVPNLAQISNQSNILISFYKFLLDISLF